MKSAYTFLLVTVFALSGCAHRYAPSEALGEGDEPFVSAEFRNGTATLEQIKAYLSPSLDMIYEDLNQDGKTDLLVGDEKLAGSGGNHYFAFEKTSKGYHYLGNLFFSRLRVLRKDASGQQKILTMSCSGSGSCNVFLIVLDAKGFHEMARAHLSAGDSGTEEDNRKANELFGTSLVSPALLVNVFGKVVE